MNRSDRIIILGAGAIGVSAAWELQRRGWQVCLIDRRPPASETSYGNAGIVSTSAAVPFNNPALLRQLPSLLSRRGAALHWRLSYMLMNLPWCLQFFYHSRPASALRRARAMYQLTARSYQLHREWLATVGRQELIREGGWIKLYRSMRGFDHAAAERHLWEQLGVPYRIIEGGHIRAILPAARDIFPAAVLLEAAYGLIGPARAIRAYAEAFFAAGGDFIEHEAVVLRQEKNDWQVQLKNGDSHSARHIVVALGPWSKPFLAAQGIKIPMGYERGGHRHFSMEGAPPPVVFTDVEGGYSAAMQEAHLRITSGVYLASLNAPPPAAQLAAAEANLREALDGVGAAVAPDWFGARPTMPDSMPLLGASRRQGLWLATGSQHIGLMTGPASGECIAQLISDETPVAAAAAFSPRRYDI